MNSSSTYPTTYLPIKNLLLKGEIVKKYDRLYRFAQHLGIHPATVTNVITGRSALEAKQQKQWAEALGRPVEELFPGEARH
jgi:plasmid maintenance system antidote protein VapI